MASSGVSHIRASQGQSKQALATEGHSVTVSLEVIKVALVSIEDWLCLMANQTLLLVGHIQLNLWLLWSTLF